MIFCTGNPQKKTIAHALGCDHASLSSGWDFLTLDTINRFQNTIINYQVFVNSSYIAPGVQLNLLNATIKAWMAKDIRGHVINIGTTLSDNSEYCLDKQKLKARSLELSDQTGITGIKTTYLSLGGVDTGEVSTNDLVSPKNISKTIKWIIEQDSRFPLIQMEGIK